MAGIFGSEITRINGDGVGRSYNLTPFRVYWGLMLGVLSKAPSSLGRGLSLKLWNSSGVQIYNMSEAIL